MNHMIQLLEKGTLSSYPPSICLVFITVPVRFLPCMNKHVSPGVCFLSKRLVTIQTAVWSELQVNLLVMLPVRHCKQKKMAWVVVIPKEGWARFFWYDTDFLDFFWKFFFFEKSVSYQKKDGHGHLLVWQWLRPLGTFSHYYTIQTAMWSQLEVNLFVMLLVRHYKYTMYRWCYMKMSLMAIVWRTKYLERCHSDYPAQYQRLYWATSRK